MYFSSSQEPYANRLDKNLTFFLSSRAGLTIFIMSVFGSVVVGIFQIIFRAKMYVNDIFLFFKNHF